MTDPASMPSQCYDLIALASMNLNSINITEIVEKTKAQLQEDKTLTPALKLSNEIILVIVVMLASKLGLNSTALLALG